MQNEVKKPISETWIGVVWEFYGKSRTKPSSVYVWACHKSMSDCFRPSIASGEKNGTRNTPFVQFISNW
jgi:hypothetical protein